MNKKIDINQLKQNILSTNTRSDTIEAYKSCRTTIKASLKEEDCKKIIIASPVMQEGKSITCANLAISFAETGEHVLIIDCNLRNPTQQLLFETQSKSNLAQFLNGSGDVASTIGKTQYENLDIIQAGEKPENPSELLGSSKMEELLNTLSNQYSYIFFDTPPINIVTDAAILAVLVPNIIFIIRKDVTKHKDIRQALEKIRFLNTSILGFILNDVNDKVKL